MWEARRLLRGRRVQGSGRAARGKRNASYHLYTCTCAHCARACLCGQVRCYSDVRLSAWSLRDGCSVWGESDAGWPCTTHRTFAQAEATCQAAGARLCTAAELVAGCTTGTGCQFDYELVWGVPSPSRSPPLPPPPPPPSQSPYVFTNTDALEEAVQAFTDDLANALSKYGPIENWEVSRITNMSGLFSGKQGFNRDVSSWNTSGVTDMSHMFAVRSDAAPLTSL